MRATAFIIRHPSERGPEFYGSTLSAPEPNYFIFLPMQRKALDTLKSKLDVLWAINDAMAAKWCELMTTADARNSFTAASLS